jgi:serine/threonine protein kinase
MPHAMPHRSLLLSTPGIAPGGAVESHELTGKVAGGLLFGSVLGRGAYGVVLRALELTTSIEYAVKVMSRSALKSKKEWVREGRLVRVTTALDKVKRELAIMAKVAHPHVVRCHFALDDETQDRIFLVLELLHGGTAMTYVDLPPPPPPPPGGSAPLASVPEASSVHSPSSAATAAASPPDVAPAADDGALPPRSRGLALAGRYACLGPPPPAGAYVATAGSHSKLLSTSSSSSSSSDDRSSSSGGGGGGEQPPLAAGTTSSTAVASSDLPPPPPTGGALLPALAGSPGVGPGLTMSMGQARRVVKDVLRGLTYLFSCAIVHRDIKPENILLTGRLGESAAQFLARPPAAPGTARSAADADAGGGRPQPASSAPAPPASARPVLPPDDEVDVELDADASVRAIGRALLADLGVAAVFDPSATDDLIKKTEGTPAFHAPEATLGNGQPFSGQASDVWAVGVCAFAFLTGQLPFPVFHGTSQDQLYRAIQADPLPVQQLLGSHAVKLLLHAVGGAGPVGGPPSHPHRLTTSGGAPAVGGGADSALPPLPLPVLRSRVALIAVTLDFVGSLLAKDPSDRLTANEALAHAWLSYREGAWQQPLPARTVDGVDDACVRHLGTSADAVTTDDEIAAVLSQVLAAGVRVPLPASVAHPQLFPWLAPLAARREGGGGQPDYEPGQPSPPSPASAAVAAAPMSPQAGVRAPPVVSPQSLPAPPSPASSAITAEEAVGSALLRTADSGRIARQLLRSQRALTALGVVSSSSSSSSSSASSASSDSGGASSSSASASHPSSHGAADGAGDVMLALGSPRSPPVTARPFAMAFAPGAAMEVTDEEVAALVQPVAAFQDAVMLKVLVLRLVLKLRVRMHARRAAAARQLAAAATAAAAAATSAVSAAASAPVGAAAAPQPPVAAPPNATTARASVKFLDPPVLDRPARVHTPSSLPAALAGAPRLVGEALVTPPPPRTLAPSLSLPPPRTPAASMSSPPPAHAAAVPLLSSPPPAHAAAPALSSPPPALAAGPSLFSRTDGSPLPRMRTSPLGLPLAVAGTSIGAGGAALAPRQSLWPTTATVALRSAALAPASPLVRGGHLQLLPPSTPAPVVTGVTVASLLRSSSPAVGACEPAAHAHGAAGSTPPSPEQPRRGGSIAGGSVRGGSGGAWLRQLLVGEPPDGGRGEVRGPLGSHPASQGRSTTPAHGGAVLDYNSSAPAAVAAAAAAVAAVAAAAPVGLASDAATAPPELSVRALLRGARRGTGAP